MVLAYLLASTLTIVRNRRGGGNLLVLGSANVDECLRGYLYLTFSYFMINRFILYEGY